MHPPLFSCPPFPLPDVAANAFRPVSLLASLTPTEFWDFFPEPLHAQLVTLTQRYETVDPSGLTPQAWARALAEADPEILIACWKTPPLPARLPPRLRYVCYLAGSVKKLVRREHLDAGLLVTNWGSSISRVVAEWALFHLLGALRHATHWTLAMHQRGAWKDAGTRTASLFGQRVGLHGFGPVARELVALLRPFGCHVSVFAPDLTPELMRQHHVHRAPSLEALFSDNRLVVELAPLIPETTGCVTEALLRLIPPGGVFVNVGRGAVVDEAALLRVAAEGNLQVGLDVYSTEPLPAHSGFRGLPNVALTPHLGGPTTDRRVDAGAFALANLQAYASGHPLNALITPAIYDAST